jgi:hypothetical protein
MRLAVLGRSAAYGSLLLDLLVKTYFPPKPFT